MSNRRIVLFVVLVFAVTTILPAAAEAAMVRDVAPGGADGWFWGGFGERFAAWLGSVWSGVEQAFEVMPTSGAAMGSGG